MLSAVALRLIGQDVRRDASLEMLRDVLSGCQYAFSPISIKCARDFNVSVLISVSPLIPVQTIIEKIAHTDINGYGITLPFAIASIWEDLCLDTYVKTRPFVSWLS